MASQTALAKSLQKLSSGSKITSPADDSAGLAVSMQLTAQMSRITAASNNIGDAISFNQTQDGYLQQMSNALNRMSELTVLRHRSACLSGKMKNQFLQFMQFFFYKKFNSTRTNGNLILT